jgi:ssDNA-binding Zn-finger/Zn-ribbon topoisomerase 1
MRKAGFDKQVDLVENGKCPLCGEDINMESFKDDVSIKEFKISGICQKCQDSIFG